VDFDLSNYLVSNVAQVSREVREGYTRTFCYELPFLKFKIDFESSQKLVQYNKDLLEILSLDLTVPQTSEADPEGTLYRTWEWLTNKHLKGIQKIWLGRDFLNRYAYQNWVFRELSNLAQKQESKLVIIK
jgi:hypothetical protein